MRLPILAVIMSAAVATGAHAADSDTITIGMTTSQTGPLNVDSLGLQQGVNMWRDEVNAAGGIAVDGKHYQIRLVTYDDQSQGSRVQQLYTRLIVQDKAQFLFGPYSSGLTATAAVISEQYDALMLTTGGAEPKTYELGNKYLYQVITPAAGYLKGAVEALQAHNPHAKLALVYSDDPFSKAVMAATSEQAKKAGLEIVMNESYSPTTTDFGPVINKIISSGADSFMGGGHYSDGATVARQLYEQKANLKWISILVAPGDDKFATLGPAALGVTTGSQWEPSESYKPEFGPTGAEFIKRYRAKFKSDPDYHAGSGYAGGIILQHAIEKAGSIDQAKVAAALDAMDVTTYFGRVKFATDPQHHGLQVSHEMVLAQWLKNDGKLTRTVVWPKEAASATLLYPIPAH